jgi:hypothetical protein
MNRLFLISLLSVSLVGTLPLLAQNKLKTITEDFQNGKVTYSYYENPETYELLKHGPFKYTESRKQEDYGIKSLTVSGNFKNGKRDGVWTYTLNQKDFDDNGEDNLVTKNINFTQTYKDGNYNGIAKLNGMRKYRSLRYWKGQRTWTSYGDTYIRNYTVTYKDNQITGNVTYKIDNKMGTINFGSSLQTGEYSTDFMYIYKQTITANTKGIVTKFVVRKKDNGSVYRKLTFDAELLDVINQYSTGKISLDELKSKGYVSDTIWVKPGNNAGLDVEEVLDIEPDVLKTDFMFTQFDGYRKPEIIYRKMMIVIHRSDDKIYKGLLDPLVDAEIPN